MGYTTEFEGQFTLDKPLTKGQIMFLVAFSETRRVKRNEFLAVKMNDPARDAAGLPVGKDGCYFVGGKGLMGQSKDSSVVDYNCPPEGQPGLWCHWAPSLPFVSFKEERPEEHYENVTTIEWDGGEKFYNYTEWLEYIIAHFLIPWGHNLNGEVDWYGDDVDDRGTITVKDNVFTAVSEEQAAQEKQASLGEFKSLVASICEYGYSTEAEDFLENIGEYHWKSEDEDTQLEGYDEIKKALDTASPRECLDIIDKYIEVNDTSHIVIKLLKAWAWMADN